MKTENVLYIQLSNKTQIWDTRNSCELLVRVIQEIPKTLNAIVIVLGFHQEVENNPLFLKTACSSDTRTDMKASSLRTTIQASKGGEQATVLSIYGTHKPQ